MHHFTGVLRCLVRFRTSFLKRFYPATSQTICFLSLDSNVNIESWAKELQYDMMHLKKFTSRCTTPDFPRTFMDVVHKLDNGLDSIFPIPTSVRSNSVAVNTEEGHTVLPQKLSHHHKPNRQRTLAKMSVFHLPFLLVKCLRRPSVVMDDFQPVHV